LLNLALATADREPSVHWVTTLGDKGHAVGTITTYAGKAVGHQTGLIQGKATITARLVNGWAYATGNALGLQALLDFKAAPAAIEAGKWLFATDAGPDYKRIAIGLTVATSIDDLEMMGTVSSAPAALINGKRALGLRGRTRPYDGSPSVLETLYVSPSATPLPVKAIQSEGSLSETTLFSEWGQPVIATAPHDAVRIKASWLLPG
jgi:hypothetical protein